MSENKKDEFIERKIVVGMIVSNGYLERVAPMYHKGLFESPEAELVAGWCLKHYRKYRAAPGKDIALIYENESKRIDDKNQRDFIEGILDSLSEEWEQAANLFNVEYLVDKTVEYFKVRSFKILSDELRLSVLNYDADMGDQLLNSFNKVQELVTTSVTPLTDSALITRAFAKESKPLFTFPGALGMEVNDQLVQGGFIGLLGPEKRGKSWWLMEFVMRACRCGVPTAFFQAGDMDDEDMTMRIHIRLAKKSNRSRYCGELWIPVLDCRRNVNDECNLRQRTCKYGLVMPQATTQKGDSQSRRNSIRKTAAQDSNTEPAPHLSPEAIVSANPDYVPCSECYQKNPLKFEGAVYWVKRESCTPLTAREAIRQGKRVAKLWKTEPRISTHASKTLTVPKIEATLDEWERVTGFVPKVIVIDYADILDCHIPRLDYRHQQNAIWEALRSLAQKRKCLVVTATQADAASYEKDTLKMTNYSEDKRKYGHVTAMWGLNQTNKERDMGIMRINQLVARNDYFNSSKSVSVLQCLQIGRPLLSSYVTK